LKPTAKDISLTVSLVLFKYSLAWSIRVLIIYYPYEYWNKEEQVGHAILSMRHAAYLAGLGSLGKNALLTNMKLGNIIQIGAVLTDTELDPDKPAEYSMCPDNCRLCIEACPANALDGKTVDQKLCRPLSNFRNERGFVLKKCNICRKICPNYAGIIPGF
jgi:epoxyqueuosine reductase